MSNHRYNGSPVRDDSGLPEKYRIKKREEPPKLKPTYRKSQGKKNFVYSSSDSEKEWEKLEDKSRRSKSMNRRSPIRFSGGRFIRGPSKLRADEYGAFNLFKPMEANPSLLAAGKPVFTCKECGKKYLSEKALVHHELQTHDCPMTCFECNKVFNCFTRWAAHIRFRHKDTKMICKFCKSVWNEAGKMTMTEWAYVRGHMYGEMVYAKLADRSS